jgi:hypothetical protein
MMLDASGSVEPSQNGSVGIVASESDEVFLFWNVDGLLVNSGGYTNYHSLLVVEWNVVKSFLHRPVTAATIQGHIDLHPFLENPGWISVVPIPSSVSALFNQQFLQRI